MGLKSVQYLLLTATVAVGCTSNGRMNDELPFIDVGKNYPEKELSITDFADVTYVHLSAENDDYLYKGRIQYVTKNTLVVYDSASGSILFFSRDGTPKSRFNRLGQGAQDYLSSSTRISTRILYDEDSDEVYVCSDVADCMQVYSSTGEYKRKVILPQYTKVFSIVSFDSQSFFMFSENFHGFAFNGGELRDFIPYTTYYWISKTDGEVLDSIKLVSNEIRLIIKKDDFVIKPTLERLSKGMDGYFLFNPETDTVYLYKKDKSLSPVFCKKPLLRDQDPMVVFFNMGDASKYQFFTTFTLLDGIVNDNFRYYYRDKETGEVFRQKIILPDYMGKDFSFIGTGLSYEEENGAVIEMDLFQLKQAYDENRLSGKLKELVATLNENEDNNVFMFVHFK